MGITMAVVDVLLSHMDRKTVQHMNPSTSLEEEEGGLCLRPEQRQFDVNVWKIVTDMPGLAPAIITIFRAMRLCRFHFSMEAARQMTPISSRVVSLQYSAAT